MIKRSYSILILGALTVSGIALVSCSTLKSEPKRNVASMLDVGLIGPQGEVILFYRKADDVTVVECLDDTILATRESCEPKSAAVKIPVNEFKDRLKLALRLPGGNYTDADKKKIELYKKGKLDDIEDLERQRKELRDGIARIDAFITRYGAINSDPKKREALADSLKKVEGQLQDNEELASAIRDINQRIDTLVEGWISKPEMKELVYSNERQGFEYNVLRTFVKTASLKSQFVPIKAGTFTMGSESGEANHQSNENQHSVTISKDFEIQQTEVTQLQYFQTVGSNPSRFKEKSDCPDSYMEVGGEKLCPNNPVENVSWVDSKIFIQALNRSKIDGYSTYRLPTEAEWEFAARGGSQTAYSFGNDANQTGDYAWFSGNSNSRTQAVGTKKANPIGLFDIHGNVWEWTEDTYGNYSDLSATDPIRSDGSYRVIRGGAWFYDAQYLRSAYRGSAPPHYRLSILGLRLVRTR